MFHLAHTTGGDHRDGDVVPNMVDQFYIKAAISNVLINTVQEYFAGTQLLTGLYQLDCVDVTSFTAAFDGALIPADLGTEN